MDKYSRVYAEIDLDAILFNLEQMKNNLNPNTKIMAVIKTDGYGHGAIPIAQLLEQLDYIQGYAVATAEEALSLRRHGIKKSILILGAVFKEQIADLIQNEVRMTVFQVKQGKWISDISTKMGKTAYIHIKVDTSMCRLGIRPEQEDSCAIVEELAKMPNLRLEGIFTHFSKADESDKKPSIEQINKFTSFISKLEKKNITFQIHHCANSAGIIDLPETGMDMVRAGISLYGMYPSNEVHFSNVKLKPAMSLHSQIVYIKDVEEGTPVSYGGTYITNKPTKIATIPVGYGDGYCRGLSNKGYVLIHGQKAPILGRVCMDQFMVDITHIPQAAEEDPVVLFGEDSGTFLPIEELCDLCGRFNYEFVCDLSKRIPRVYKKNGKVIGTKDWFHE